MEGLKTVRDGSTATYKNGYDLINVIACKEQQDGCRIMPLSSDLVASNINSDSVIQLTQDILIDIILATGNKGVFIFDRGYDRRTVYSFLKDNECDFIVRAKGNRNLILNGVEQKFHDVVKKVKLNKKIASKDGKHSFLCGMKRVEIRLNSHPVKHPDTAGAWLVVARYQSGRNGEEGGSFYFLCDFPNQDLDADMIMEKVLKMYRLRWKIEEVHKHVKQEYGWEKMQLMSAVSLENMNKLLLLAMCYVYSLKSMVHELYLSFPHLMTYSHRLWKKIYDFSYYKISRVLRHCFAYTKRYDIRKYGGKWVEDQQMIIPCLKNGGM